MAVKRKYEFNGKSQTREELLHFILCDESLEKKLEFAQLEIEEFSRDFLGVNYTVSLNLSEEPSIFRRKISLPFYLMLGKNGSGTLDSRPQFESCGNLTYKTIMELPYKTHLVSMDSGMLDRISSMSIEEARKIQEKLRANIKKSL